MFEHVVKVKWPFYATLYTLNMYSPMVSAIIYISCCISSSSIYVQPCTGIYSSSIEARPVLVHVCTVYTYAEFNIV